MSADKSHPDYVRGLLEGYTSNGVLEKHWTSNGVLEKHWVDRTDWNSIISEEEHERLVEAGDERVSYLRPIYLLPQDWTGR